MCDTYDIIAAEEFSVQILVTSITLWLKSKSAQQQMCFHVMPSSIHQLKAALSQSFKLTVHACKACTCKHGLTLDAFHCAHAHTFLSPAHLKTITIYPAQQQLTGSCRITTSSRRGANRRPAPCGPGPMPGCNCRHPAPDPNTSPHPTQNPIPPNC